MADCPTELWQHIFACACTDGGRTGCSLSLVSKFVREASAPFRYQSVLVEGTARLSCFLAVWERNPDRRSKILHLLLYDTPPHHTYRPSASPRFIRLSDEWVDLMCRLLSAVSHSLLTLTIYMKGARSFLLPPVAFPTLEELSVQGDYFDAVCDQAVSLPKLSALHFGGTRRLWKGGMTASLLPMLSKVAPALTHLAVTSDASFDWREALAKPKCKPNFDSSSQTKLAALFPSLQHVAVRLVPWQPKGTLAFQAAYEAQWEVLRKVSVQKHAIEFELRPARRIDEDPYPEMKESWLKGASTGSL